MLSTLARAAGERAVRPGTREDAIDEIVPAAVVEPETPEVLARVLAVASEASLRLVVRGGGTKLGWGRVPDGVDVVLETRRLSKLVSHAHGDLTAEAEAGMPLSAFNRALGGQRQWLPIDSAFESATIGGIVASNDAGPVRHRYGTPRDLLIGVHLATPDGRLVRAGGNVVKNVAGYDLGRLVTGSFGSLAVVVSATFKLTPLAPAHGTQRFTFAEISAAAAAAHALAASQLDPIALDVHAAGGAVELLVRFASTPAVVEAEMAKAARLVSRFDAQADLPAVGAEDEAIWLAQVRRPWEGAGTVIKVNWPPAALERLLALIGDLRREGIATDLTARAGVGVGLLRVEGTPAAQADVVRRLRDRTDIVERAIVLRAPLAVKAAVDVWGDAGDSVPLQAAIKRAFDPAGIMNAGRGPV